MNNATHTRILGLLLFLLVTIVYLPAVKNGFIWDDPSHVTDNALLKTTDGLRRIWLEPWAAPQYYPMTLTVFWVEHALWGLNPVGYHLVNILLHAMNSVLLWHLLGRLAVPGSLLIATAFAVHPVHVESVAWVSELKNTLSGFFISRPSSFYGGIIQRSRLF